ncbi:hypothetical protein BDK51DRAFT_49974 [Blyttiomyces helicus]|uniref:Uncharacterized protein n=1 Tax=Blyttiomyces helicus TaxID=388810 RepID=A0A4P9VX26_9FUNG|nr:hypothetical protein BDK51DRAFT_49974 [Blyttiomyces helicus]|eukprot:RKO83425.1 hypothetical protein BDK51DRAFT_49974 [Blyttiomyces helicus]
MGWGCVEVYARRALVRQNGEAAGDATGNNVTATAGSSGRDEEAQKRGAGDDQERVDVHCFVFEMTYAELWWAYPLLAQRLFAIAHANIPRTATVALPLSHRGGPSTEGSGTGNQKTGGISGAWIGGTEGWIA